MPKLVRHEFVGKRWILFPLHLIPFFFPLALFCLVEGTVTVHHEMEDPEAFLARFRGDPPRG